MLIGIEELDSKDELLAAAFTGGITALITTPLDLVKTKLMVQSATGGAYSGVIDALRRLTSLPSFAHMI